MCGGYGVEEEGRAANRSSSARPEGLRPGAPRARVAPRRGAAARARRRSGSSTGSTTTSLGPASRSAPGSGSWPRTGATSSPLSATARRGGSACTAASHPLRAVAPRGSAPEASRRSARCSPASSTSRRRSRRTSPGGATCSCRSRRFEALESRHAAAVPASLLLLATAPYLWRRRQRRAAAGARAARSRWPRSTCSRDSTSKRPPAASGSAAILWLGRDSFCVRHDPVTLRSTLRLVPLVAAGGLLLCGLAVWIAAPESASLVAIAP